MTENILQFPKNKIVRENLSDNPDIEKMKAKGKRNFADSIIAEMSERMLYEMTDIGIDVEEPELVKDFHLLVGILSATIYRTMDIEHPFHKFIDERVMFIPIEDGDDSYLNGEIDILDGEDEALLED